MKVRPYVKMYRVTLLLFTIFLGSNKTPGSLYDWLEMSTDYTPSIMTHLVFRLELFATDNRALFTGSAKTFGNVSVSQPATEGKGCLS